MCGIVGGLGIPKVAAELKSMLYFIQHRGQESAGMVTTGGEAEGRFCEHRANGLVNDVFTPDVLVKLQGGSGIGHNRYPTQENAVIQPVSREVGGEKWSVAHNGNLTNDIADFAVDTLLILDNLCDTDSSQPVPERVFAAIKDLQGAFSLLILHQDKEGRNTLLVVRDPQGFRPLCMAQYNGGYLFASESCAFNAIAEATFVRHIEAGEIVYVNAGGLNIYKPQSWQGKRKARCIFELIYFSRPDSRVETEGQMKNPVYVGQVQEELGRELARENPDVAADILVPVPMSGIRHAEGFHNEDQRIPLCQALTRSHYGQRTFIADGEGRLQKILRKFIFIIYLLSDKYIALVEDSIVRGSTMAVLIKAIKQVVGRVRGIVVLIASPPIKFPCFFGIYTPKKKELAFNKFGGVEQTRENIGADDLRYLSFDGMMNAVCRTTGIKAGDYCAACFSGEYPACVEIKNPQYRQEIE